MTRLQGAILGMQRLERSSHPVSLHAMDLGRRAQQGLFSQSLQPVSEDAITEFFAYLETVQGTRSGTPAHVPSL